MHRELTWKYRENKIYKLPDTMRQIYIELENSKIIPQNKKLHKISEITTNVSRRYSSSSLGIKSKHRVESIGSLKTGKNGKYSQFMKPENTSIYSVYVSTEGNLDTTN